MAWLKYIALLPALYTFVFTTVKFIEDIAEGLPGADKKALFMQALKDGWAAFQAAFGFKAEFATFELLISLLVDFIVAILNATGVFKKNVAAPPVA
jgi:hypothetical protein